MVVTSPHEILGYIVAIMRVKGVFAPCSTFLKAVMARRPLSA
jgi:hypothetical protein